MKFQETHFEEYITAVTNKNLNQKLEKYYSHFPSSIEKLGNLIFYGPSGVGKYSQMLYSIKRTYIMVLSHLKKMIGKIILNIKEWLGE
jgi:DNA replication protein DnaC